MAHHLQLLCKVAAARKSLASFLDDVLRAPSSIAFWGAVSGGVVTAIGYGAAIGSPLCVLGLVTIAMSPLLIAQVKNDLRIKRIRRKTNGRMDGWETDPDIAWLTEEFKKELAQTKRI